jgi:hypothetical protein
MEFFPMLSAAEMESTFALNVLQKLDHCFTITIFFVVSQCIANSESGFIFIGIGGYGKQSDGGTFSAFTLYYFIQNFESTLPKPESFEESAAEMPVILGDEAYPLKTYLMKPLVRKDVM